MFQKFSLRHIPALYFAFSNCVGAVLTPLRGASTTIELYGLPPHIANVPETWPVWEAGQGRIVLLGLLMHYFYWTRQYAVCDTLLMGVAWLGINDSMVVWNHGDTAWALVRLFGSFAFASTGYLGLTQGPSRGLGGGGREGGNMNNPYDQVWRAWVLDAIGTELPHTSEWTPIHVNRQLLHVTAIASGQILVGPELCHEEEYIDNAINFTIDVMKAVASVALMPVWLRPLLSPIVPFVRALQRRIQGEKELLQPVVHARRRAVASARPSTEPDDLLQWFINDQAEVGVEDDMDIVHKQMVTSFAAVHTSAQTMTNMFYTLAAKPEIAAMLREEVQEVLAKYDEEFTVKSLQDLKRMDSFAKETMRYYPLMAASVQRKVLKTFTLSNGQVIPAGVIVEAANKAICDDPEIYENPEVFDALRFYKIRQAKDESRENAKSELVANATNSQFVSTGPLSLWWGYGKHACPGRFFASNMIKIVTAKVSMQYEVKLPDGVTERYENITYGDITMPDAEKTILVRKR